MLLITKPDTIAPSQTLTATIGMFDGVHLGHISLLRQLRHHAASRGEQSAVVTFADHPQNVLHHAGLKWICTLPDRLRSLEAQGIDYCIMLPFTPALAALTSAQFMDLLHRHYRVGTLLTGFNHHFGSDRASGPEQYQEQARQLGLTVLQAHEYQGPYAPVSSTIIRQLISQGKVDEAMCRLDEPFRVRGIVVHGHRNGRRLGFPTANVGLFSPALILPPNGAYAVMATVEGYPQPMPAMANIGTRPTLHNGDNISVEVNIFSFDDDIYDRHITVHFIKMLRPETQFPDIEALKIQLAHDRGYSQQLLSRLQEPHQPSQTNQKTP